MNQNTIKAHAKVNIFLKITGHKDGYHTLISRFMRVDDLYDTIRLISQECDEFTIEGCEGVDTTTNTIYKAYLELYKTTQNENIITFFKHHKVSVTKSIPSQAGLGGGSSDAAAFMRLVNEVCELNLSREELSRVGSRIGADLPFFIYNYPSANVSGFGEIVEAFDEEVVTIECFTPPIGCDTAVVYKSFKENFLSQIDLESFTGWEQKSSQELLETIKDPLLLNDLYLAAEKAYPDLKKYAKEGWFFSGSGSTFFRLK